MNRAIDTAPRYETWPKVAVIILNWNNWSDTLGCVDSLNNLEYQRFELIIVDNGSTNDSVSRIRAAFPRIRVIEAPRNLGFAVGSNIGIREALNSSADYVWLLNSDTLVDPVALNASVLLAQGDLKVGAVGSAIYSMGRRDRLEVWGGGQIDCWLGRSVPFSKPTNNEAIQFLTGASMLIRKVALEDVGLFDEQFFMYWEDVDLSFRLRQAGWKLAVAPASKVWHRQTQKNPHTKELYFDQSARLFFAHRARHARPIRIVRPGSQEDKKRREKDCCREPASGPSNRLRSDSRTSLIRSPRPAWWMVQLKCLFETYISNPRR